MAITGIDDITRPDGTAITEIFDPNLGIVVLGKQNLEDADCTIDMIRLMIQEHGIRIFPAAAVATPPDPGPFVDHLTIRRCSPEIRADLGQFSFLLEIAEQQQYLPARFLILYQIVEAFISRLYEHAVRALVKDPRLLSNVWDLREEFEKISREKSRINKLFSDYLDPKPPEFHGLTEQVKTACLAFLRKADPSVAREPTAHAAAAPPADDPPVPQPVPDVAAVGHAPAPAGPPADLAPPLLAEAQPFLEPAPAASPVVVPGTTQSIPPALEVAAATAGTIDLSQKGWAEILYRCRNLIVHRQWQMKTVPEAELRLVCSTLEQVYFLTLNCFVAAPKQAALPVVAAPHPS